MAYPRFIEAEPKTKSISRAFEFLYLKIKSEILRWAETSDFELLLVCVKILRSANFTQRQMHLNVHDCTQIHDISHHGIL